MKKVVSLFIIFVLLGSIIILLNSENVSADTCYNTCYHQRQGCNDQCTESGRSYCDCMLTEDGACRPTGKCANGNMLRNPVITCSEDRFCPPDFPTCKVDGAKQCSDNRLCYNGGCRQIDTTGSFQISTTRDYYEVGEPFQLTGYERYQGQSGGGIGGMAIFDIDVPEEEGIFGMPEVEEEIPEETPEEEFEEPGEEVFAETAGIYSNSLLDQNLFEISEDVPDHYGVIGEFKEKSLIFFEEDLRDGILSKAEIELELDSYSEVANYQSEGGISGFSIFDVFTGGNEGSGDLSISKSQFSSLLNRQGELSESQIQDAVQVHKEILEAKHNKIEEILGDGYFSYDKEGNDFLIKKIGSFSLSALINEKILGDFYYNYALELLLNKALETGQVRDVWDVEGGGYRGRGVIISVIDTGISFINNEYHPDFQGSIIQEYCFSSIEGGTCYDGLNFEEYQEGFGVAKDKCGHGTMCAGIALGGGKLSNGKFVGVAPEAKLIVVNNRGADGSDAYCKTFLTEGACEAEKPGCVWEEDYLTGEIACWGDSVYGEEKTNQIYYFDLTNAVKKVYPLSDVISISAGQRGYRVMGKEGCEESELGKKTKFLNQIAKRFPIIVAVGNMGNGGSGFPNYQSINGLACNTHIISVGASSKVPRDEKEHIMAFSSRGQPEGIGEYGDYPLKKPDIVAPIGGFEYGEIGEGGGICTTDFLGKDHLGFDICEQEMNYFPFYERGSGTSSAAPYIAGVVALMKEANPHSSILEIKGCLYSSADKVIYDLIFDEIYEEYSISYNLADRWTQGYGRVNALGAVRCIQQQGSTQKRNSVIFDGWELMPVRKNQCNDGMDNDGDGLIDMEEDDGCDNSENPDAIFSEFDEDHCGNGDCESPLGETWENCCLDCSENLPNGIGCPTIIPRYQLREGWPWQESEKEFQQRNYPENQNELKAELNTEGLVSGVINVKGSANNGDLRYSNLYRVSYSENWAGPYELIGQQKMWLRQGSGWQNYLVGVVNNHNLASNWDTSKIPDGNYFLKLELFKLDGDTLTEVGSDITEITIDNDKIYEPDPENYDDYYIGEQVEVWGNVLDTATFENYDISWGYGDQTGGQRGLNRRDGIELLKEGGTRGCNGCAIAKWDTSGLDRGGWYTIQLTVNRDGFSNTHFVKLYLKNPVKIVSPYYSETRPWEIPSGDRISITGFVMPPNFERYEIKYRRQGTGVWKTEGLNLIGNGWEKRGNPEYSAVLGKLDTVDLVDGIYDLKLIAYYGGEVIEDTSQFKIKFVPSVLTNRGTNPIEGYLKCDLYEGIYNFRDNVFTGGVAVDGGNFLAIREEVNEELRNYQALPDKELGPGKYMLKCYVAESAQSRTSLVARYVGYGGRIYLMPLEDYDIFEVVQVGGQQGRLIGSVVRDIPIKMLNIPLEIVKKVIELLV
ncbi:MAG: S8 family serine peptidase [Patescibacteria group bacterium]